VFGSVSVLGSRLKSKEKRALIRINKLPGGEVVGKYGFWGAKLQPIENIGLQRSEKELTPVFSGSNPGWGMEHRGRTDTALLSSDHL